MRVLIVSDSHRHNTNLLAVLERTGPYDMLIHCGDVEGSEYTISEAAGLAASFMIIVCISAFLYIVYRLTLSQVCKQLAVRRPNV